MGTKRAIFGTLRLWSHARSLAEQEDRGNPAQVVLGVDQDRALVVPDSPNAAGGIEVVTWGGPGAAKTQAAWIAQKAAIREALRARHGYGLPLVWCEDDDFDAVLASGAGTSYVTAAAHAFEVGDVVYFYRPSDATDRAALFAFGWATVTATPTSTGLTFDEDPSTDDYAPEAGDLLVRVSSLFDPLYCGGIRQMGRPAKGDYYSPEIVWPFTGVPTTEIHRTPGSVVP